MLHLSRFTNNIHNFLFPYKYVVYLICLSYNHFKSIRFCKVLLISIFIYHKTFFSLYFLVFNKLCQDYLIICQGTQGIPFLPHTAHMHKYSSACMTKLEQIHSVEQSPHHEKETINFYRGEFKISLSVQKLHLGILELCFK